MKNFWLIVFTLIFTQSVFAFDIVYPKRTEVTINSPTTFFVGSSNKPLTINGIKADIHPSTGFAYFVTLKEGKNIFELKTEDEKKIYTITRPQKVSYNCTTVLKPVEYAQPVYITNNVENAPLRSSPTDYGINRIAHLQKGVELISNGEENGFYRIILSGNKYGWIYKNNVIKSEKTAPAIIQEKNYSNDKDYYTFTFKLNKRVPYEIEEGEIFKLTFYNLKNGEDDKYTFEFPYSLLTESEKIVGYSGKYDGNKFIFKIRKPNKISNRHPLKNITVAVDAGHGGNEYGAIGCLGDKEKDIVLKIAQYLKEELESRGVTVIMTRDSDTYTDLYDRVKTANENDSEIFISIHANALPDTLNPLTHQGTSVYYYYNQAKALAGNILISMNSQLNTKNDKVRQESFAVIRNTAAVSVLIETAYLINPEDNAMLIQDEFQHNCAKAIADGIEHYITEK